MFKGKRIGALLLMGGAGLRFGNPVPKQFALLGGKKVFEHALDTFKACGLFDEILIVCHPDWIDQVEGAIPGGSTRQQSSYFGLKSFQKKPDIVLIHDAVRPNVREKIILENVELAIEMGAVDTCIRSTDTLVFAPNGHEIQSIPNRKDYWRGQTPQTFQYDLLLKAHEKALQEGIFDATDDCQLVLKMGQKVQIVEGDETNLKITTAHDLKIAESFLEKMIDLVE